MIQFCGVNSLSTLTHQRGILAQSCGRSWRTRPQRRNSETLSACTHPNRRLPRRSSHHGGHPSMAADHVCRSLRRFHPNYMHRRAGYTRPACRCTRCCAQRCRLQCPGMPPWRTSSRSPCAHRTTLTPAVCASEKWLRYAVTAIGWRVPRTSKAWYAKVAKVSP